MRKSGPRKHCGAPRSATSSRWKAPTRACGTGTSRATPCSSRHVRIAVADTGSGIPPAVLERIFDPFFTTKEVGVGTGLGLSLVHGIATDLGGGIDVESEPGKGAAFTVYLPWSDAVAAPAALELAIAKGDGETILVVDDEEP